MGFLPTIELKILFLIVVYVGQCNKKWDSVSTDFGQNGQTRISFGSFLCRPVSIINLWFESLNFVSSVLIWGSSISDKYPSNPIFVLKIEYVLSLLLLHLMDSKAV